jgi:hypothetical protein
MESGPLFDDQETVLMSVPLARVVGVIIALGGMGVLLIALALSPWRLDAETRMVLLVLAVTGMVVAAHITSTRLRFQGKSFEVHRLFSESRGSAEEFLGWRSGLFSDHAHLLRREDLRWVDLPALDWSESLNSDRYRWLYTYLPGIDGKALRTVRRRSELPPGTARMLIDRPLPELPQGEFYGRPEDVDLARAARAIAKFRYTDARDSLERLLPRLPQPSVATAYVFDALRSVGTQETAAALERVMERYRQERAHLARAFGALATRAERPTLERMQHDEDRFVRHQAREALRRLAQEASGASRADGEA